MKRIVLISYFYEPDLSAGSFRNTALSKVLSRMAAAQDCMVEVYTSTPNRYDSYKVDNSLEEEHLGNLIIYRVKTVQWGRGKVRVILAFIHYFLKVLWMNRGKKTDLVFASSSKYFSSFLGYVLARRKGVKLYLDIRDLFALNLQEIQVSRIFKVVGAPFMFWMERMAFRYANHINIVSGGFRSYVSAFTNAHITEFTNGIDDIFLEEHPAPSSDDADANIRTILYAGNIGEGQGLHKIVPEVARELGSSYRFLIYGDGAMRPQLEEKLREWNLANVEIRTPVKRNLLIQEYQKADFLFLHLNDYEAFKKVLPSKIFELSSFDKPILAGVGGFPAEFIRAEVRGSHVFNPCDAGAMVAGIRQYENAGHIDRSEFLEKFSRSRIALDMSRSILSYL